MHSPWQISARRLHVITAVVTIAALVLQTGLVISGESVLAEGDPPVLLTRLGRLVSYFTIQSNLLVALTATLLARNPDRDGSVFRVARLAAIVGITVTGLVHFFLLRPLLDLESWSWVADKALHMVVPVLALGSWLVVGPRPRVDLRAIGGALAWPILWLGWTLGVGRLSGWYPYPLPRHRGPGRRLRGRGEPGDHRVVPAAARRGVRRGPPPRAEDRRGCGGWRIAGLRRPGASSRTRRRPGQTGCRPVPCGSPS